MGGVSDLRRLDVIGLDLAKRRTELERLIAPYVTTKRTSFIINFKNKRCYLKSRPPGYHGSIHSLQCLYEIEAAHKTGDIDKAIRLAIWFGGEDLCRELYELTGVDVFDAVFGRARQQPGWKAGAKKTNELKAAKRPNYRATVMEGMTVHKLSYTKAVKRAVDIHDCDEKTIRNHVPNPDPQNRGRWKKGRKSAKRRS